VTSTRREAHGARRAPAAEEKVGGDEEGVRPVAHQRGEGGIDLLVGAGIVELDPQPEHQDYLERYPNGYTCHFVRPQWKLRQEFPAPKDPAPTHP
jgi:hypothetical protein